MEKVWLSATQIDNFKRCPRIWAWEKIVGLKQPRSKPLELGSRVHDILEAFFKHGTPPPLTEKWRFNPGEELYYPGEIAASMLPTLEPFELYKKDVKTEMMFEDHLLGKSYGVVYTGKIDLHYTVGKRFHVIDHKTSSDPSQWSKTIGDLGKDTQGILYPRVVFNMYPKCIAGDFTLNYGSTKLQTSKNKLVTIPVERRTLLEKFDRDIAPVAMQMAELKQNRTHPLELPPNSQACNMFGGCPRRDDCKLTSKERLSAFMSGKSLVQEMMARQAAKRAAELKASPEEVEDQVDINPPEREEKPVEEKPVEEKPVEEKPVEEKPVEEKPKPRAKKRNVVKKPDSETTGAIIVDDPVKPETAPQSGSKNSAVPGLDDFLIGYLAGLAIGANPSNKEIVLTAIEKVTGQKLQ